LEGRNFLATWSVKSSVSNAIRVLLVDDREENLLAFKTALRDIDCETITSGSGAEALLFLKENEVAVVLLDVQMPIMDGFETAARIRKTELSKSTPILFVTALDRTDEHTTSAYSLGAVDFIYKPVAADALRAKVSFFVNLFAKTKELERKNLLFELNAESEKTVLLDNALDAVVGANEENQIIFWNKHAEQIFGWSKDEIMGSDLSESIVPDRFRAAHRAGLKRFIETGIERIHNRRIEIPALRKNGEEFPLELSLTSVRSKSGYRFYSFMRDLTEVKNASQRLIESESKFRSLTEVLPAIVYIADGSGNLHYINERWYEFTGYKPGDLSGESWAAAIHPDDMAGVGVSWQNAQSSGIKWTHEYRLRRHDGVYRWHLGTSVPGRGAGETDRWVGAVLDIDDQKSVAKALEETNQNLEGKVQERTKELSQAYLFVDSVLENIPNMIFGKDALDLKFVRFNKAGEKLIGTTKENLIGKNDFDFFPPEEAKAFQEKDRAVLAGQVIVDIPEEPISTISNGPRILHTKKIPVNDSNGKPRYLLGISEDITERKQVEKERLDLIQAQNVNRLKDEFLANLSHELRTPMNVILGHAEILINDAASAGVSDEFKASVEAIQRNAKSQTAIITDLLDVSSIITGKISYKPSDVVPEKIVRDVIEGFEQSAKSKGIELKSRVLGCPKSMLADPTRLNQIFWNLLSNAIKFTGAGGKVEVSLHCEDEELVVEVADTGAGIEPGFLPYVFDRFRQQDASTTRRYGGLGLGLSIVRNLAELHGGRVRAESAGQGLGSKFTILIPIRHGNVLAPSSELVQRPQSLSEEKAAPRQLDGIKILLVEDSADNRALVIRMLAKAGANVIDADGAAQARERLRSFEPDIIVSDIGMPEENGIDFIKSLRATGASHQRGIPAIALTAYVREQEMQTALAAGFQTHVAKPVSAPVLIKAILDTALRH
jgi:PAS domain S-box-containing protein